MSEQENSRSPPSTTLPAEPSAGNTKQEQEQEAGVDTCHTGNSSSSSSSCSSAGPHTGMGNNVFSAPEENIAEAGCTQEGKEEETVSKTDQDGQAKDGPCEDTQEEVPRQQEAAVPDLKEGAVPRGSSENGDEQTSDYGTGEGEERRDDAEGEERRVDGEGEERRDNGEGEKRRDNGEGEESVEGRESHADASKECANNLDTCKGQEAQGEENTQGKSCEGNENISKNHSDEGHTVELSQVQGSGELVLHREEEGPAEAEIVLEANTDAVAECVASIMNEDHPTPPPATLDHAHLPTPAQGVIPENGAVMLEAPVVEATRDTDSEAGDSMCSEDGDHGEVCRGGGDCPHQGAEEGWEYVVDEEFNVPRRPVFNGAADHLERRSSLKRRASEEAEGKAAILFPYNSLPSLASWW